MPKNRRPIRAESRIGRVHKTYDELVALLGEPNNTHNEDPDKTTAGWHIEGETVDAFVWNYKIHHADPECTAFSVGGDVALLSQTFGDSLVLDPHYEQDVIQLW